MKNSKQVDSWNGDFGRKYTDRNTLDMNSLYVDEIGITREALNREFFGDLDISNVLEVGSNIGLQLKMFEDMGICSSLYGVEPQRYAIKKSKRLFSDSNIDIVQGVGESLPFKDNQFELVMTNGVLIHVAPENLDDVVGEVFRCSGKYIFGYEYYSDNLLNKEYRGNDGLLWLNDFCNVYMENFPSLSLVRKSEYYNVSDRSLKYQAFLLQKAE